MTYVRGLLLAVRIESVASTRIPKMIQAHRVRCAIECVDLRPPATIGIVGGFTLVTLALAPLFVGSITLSGR